MAGWVAVVQFDSKDLCQSMADLGRGTLCHQGQRVTRDLSQIELPAESVWFAYLTGSGAQITGGGAEVGNADGGPIPSPMCRFLLRDQTTLDRRYAKRLAMTGESCDLYSIPQKKQAVGGRVNPHVRSKDAS